MPGVRLVFTAADLPQPVPRFGPQFGTGRCIATGETKYHGDPVAVVAAETLDAAEEARAAVRVDVRGAAGGHHDRAARWTRTRRWSRTRRSAPATTSPAANVLREHRYGWGDVDAAEAQADVVVEDTYTFPMVTQFAIEPHAFMAAPDGDGIAVWSSIQHPNWLQRVIASLLDLPLAKVRVLAPDPGGAFGGKQHAKYEPLLAFMARRRAGRSASCSPSRRRSRPSAAAPPTSACGPASGATARSSSTTSRPTT